MFTHLSLLHGGYGHKGHKKNIAENSPWSFPLLWSQHVAYPFHLLSWLLKPSFPYCQLGWGEPGATEESKMCYRQKFWLRDSFWEELLAEMSGTKKMNIQLQAEAINNAGHMKYLCFNFHACGSLGCQFDAWSAPLSGTHEVQGTLYLIWGQKGSLGIKGGGLKIFWDIFWSHQDPWEGNEWGTSYLDQWSKSRTGNQRKGVRN